MHPSYFTLLLIKLNYIKEILHDILSYHTNKIINVCFLVIEISLIY